ncbi:type II toxin-antitoxin system VapC family toxin [uncultured Phenylobacterium sp.]|uniref:type II toxin-antitoxin system VapC family toxin n=1 Tax=uncultured Phenylobacterium sp. TaxID=349273 RepID=UPI0025ED6ECB|nr:type II toxin-antitoxin system VapC family toxin [uncultured Phenylobacterium sp.]
MADVVLDASAILARILDEPGCEIVDRVIGGAVISAVNLTEVAQRLVDLGVDDALVIDTIGAFSFQVVGLDEALALQAGLMRRATRSRGLSLADRACLALGLRLGLPVYTADRAWADLDLGVEVVLIR